MNLIYSEQQLKDLKAVFYIKPVLVENLEVTSSLCQCCGSTGEYKSDTQHRPLNGRIVHTAHSPDKIPDIPDGWDGLIIPDEKLNLLITWEKQV